MAKPVVIKQQDEAKVNRLLGSKRGGRK